MPRGVKKPGNQHNSRHENGVVAPGKRITKRKSNGYLNGSVEGSALTNGVLTGSPPAHTTTRLADKRISSTGSTSKGGFNAVGDSEAGPQDTSTDALEGLPNGICHANGSIEHAHRKIDVNTAKKPLVHDNSFWHLSLTILWSCPLGDTIAILMLLLSLPPTLLTVTNALFAILTFITPAGAFALPTTFHEIFQGSGGFPSLATIFLTDVIGVMVWLVIGESLQALSLELAQAVVATTMGGSTSNKKNGSDRTLLCMSIVTFRYGARHQWMPTRLFGYDWPAILSSIPSSRNHPLFSGADFITTRSPIGWFRILLALHILVQGLVHVARRWYQKRDYAQTVSNSKRSDPEAIAGVPARLATNPSTDTSSPALTSSAEAPMKLSAALVKERDKISSGKKKRKQGIFVRGLQPLWAALAHTKVTIVRVKKQSQKQSEIAGSGATDTKNLGSAPFEVEAGYVWISDVLPTSFRFDTSYFVTLDSERTSTEKMSVISSSGIDRSKPLYVRINDTDWTSTTIERSGEMDESANGRWSGEVFGLMPSSSYRCSFVQSEDGVVFHSNIVTTPPSLYKDRDSNVSMTAPTHRSHRPSSPKTPTTTLKESISAFENSLTDSQTRQKRSKKDNKTVTSALKKEIEVFISKIFKFGSEDKAHSNRQLQWNQHTKQADEAASVLSEEIEFLSCLPEDEVTVSKERKMEWDEVKDEQTIIREDLLQTKDDVNRKKSTAQSEASTTQQKRERLSGRRNRLNDQHEKLKSVTAQGLDEKGRKDSEQSARDLEHLQCERGIQDQIPHYQQAIQESHYVKQQIWQQIQILQTALYEQRPITPEGDLPGTVPQSSTSPAFRFPAFGSPDNTNNLRSHSGSLRNGDSRRRSTSMRSGNSVYADFEDEDPAPPMPTRAVEVIRERGRKQSGGSGSGSSGSQRDPTSPLAGSLAQTSPVGKRSPVWNN